MAATRTISPTRATGAKADIRAWSNKAKAVKNPPKDDRRKTSFVEILLYTFGFMGAMALLAAAVVWVLRLLSK